MSEALHDVRRQRLSALLAEQGWDAVLAFGNAWHADYLRYASDFAAGEGDAVAVFAEAVRRGCSSRARPRPNALKRNVPT